MHRSRARRRRRSGLAFGGVAVVAGLVLTASYRAAAPPRAPAFVPRPGVKAPSLSSAAGVLHITNNDIPAVLVPDTVRPGWRDAPARLLFFEGRSTQPTTTGSIVVDDAGAILQVDERLRAAFLPVDAGTRRIVSAARTASGRLWVADAAGAVLRRDSADGAFYPIETPFAFPALALDPTGDAVWAVRSPRQFDFPLDTGPEPVAVRLTASRPAQTRTVGEAILPEHVLLRTLANAGHLVVSGDTLYFAPFIRDEIVAFGPAGDTLWVASRALPQSTREPRFEIDDGRPVIDYHPVNLGLALGLDGRLYVLSTPGFTTMHARLDVFDAGTGLLLRSTELATPLPTLAADASGGVYLLDPERLIGGVPPAARAAGPELELPRLGGGSVSLDDLAGEVVLVNVWASWCQPCRREMPALDRLRQRLPDADFAFLAVNEDHDVADAKAFVDEFRFGFPVLLGRGAAEDVFHYPGLPYTVLLDAKHRVVRTWIGELSPADLGSLEAMIRRELDGRSDGRAMNHRMP